MPPAKIPADIPTMKIGGKIYHFYTQQSTRQKVESMAYYLITKGNAARKSIKARETTINQIGKHGKPIKSWALWVQWEAAPRSTKPKTGAAQAKHHATPHKAAAAARRSPRKAIARKTVKKRPNHHEQKAPRR
jgi:hypothetical protein